MGTNYKDISIEELGLSNRSMNALKRAEVYTLDNLLQYDEESLYAMRNLGAKSVNELLEVIEKYSFGEFAGTNMIGTVMAKPKRDGVFRLLDEPECQDKLLEYVRMNDCEITSIGLSNRSRNQLLKNGYFQLSQIILMKKHEISSIPAIGNSSVNEIISVIERYLKKNENAIMAFCSGDSNALLSDDIIANSILSLFKNFGFKGLSFKEIKEGLRLPDFITDERVKNIIGGLIKDRKLEYVDFRCYRVFERFEDVLRICPKLTEREIDFVKQRLDGITLEEIGKKNELTRERVRQIVNKSFNKVKNYCYQITGLPYFDEDYYTYFYSKYDFDKRDGSEWLGVSPYIWNYLDMRGIKRGTENLDDALDDYHNLDLGFRLKIKNYLNRNKLFLDDEWVKKKRNDLERFVIRKLCKEDVSFDEFTKIYNNFLKKEGVKYDPNIYITEEVYFSRKNRLAELNCLLWKQNERIRYYDIEGRDFTELLDTLNISSYKNTEISTLKFFECYPELMEKYDIHDQYELHNLLRKILKDGDYNDIHFGKMPMLTFGKFDRNLAVLKMLIDNSPVSTEEICGLLHDEYGYEPATVMGSYLEAISEYYHNGIYEITHKNLSVDRREKLAENLKDDFYYLDEIRSLYSELYEDAEPEDIDPYTLKKIGFTVYSKYALKGYGSLDEYFENLLTEKDVIDITPLRSRYTYVVTFTSKIMELKRSLQMIEFEPNKLISIVKLEKAGVTKEAIRKYCDKVYGFVDEGKAFSIKSIKSEGFEIPHNLEELGFSDWFYSQLLLADDRFSYGNFFSNMVFVKGKINLTIKEFALQIIKEYEVIDRDDLLRVVKDKYGCHVKDFWDIYYRVQDTGVYYDDILYKVYLTKELYYQEIEEMGNL